MEKAERYDQLSRVSAWPEVLEFAATIVNNTVIEATSKKYEPRICEVMVIRWDAQRELLDAIIGEVEGTRKQRDELKIQFGKTPEEENNA